MYYATQNNVKYRKEGDCMKKFADAFSFCLSLVAFVVSWILVKEFGMYEISYGDGVVVVDGGWFLIGMNAARLLTLAVLCVMLGVKLFSRKKPE